MLITLLLPIIFFGITLVGVLGIFLLFWRKRGVEKEEKISSLMRRREPDIIGEEIVVDMAVDRQEPKIEVLPVREIPDKELIVFYLLASEDRKFSGYELWQALLDAGLRFGKMNIFHQFESEQEDAEVLFSVASASEPGTFDVANMGGFSCQGLSFFIFPKKVSNFHQAFERMIAVSRCLEKTLGGRLYDENKELLA